MKIIFSLFALLAIVNCEPPVPNNQYFGPSLSGSRPSGRGGLGSYGVPNQSFNVPKQNNNIPLPQYGPPEQTGALQSFNQFNNNALKQFHDATNGINGILSQSYGAPRVNGGTSRQAPRQSSGFPSGNRQSFGNRNQNNGHPSQSLQSNIPNQSYGVHTQSIELPIDIPNGFNDITSQSYGVPLTSNNDISQSYGVPNANNGAPSQSYGIPSANSVEVSGGNQPSPFRLTINSPPPSQSYGPPVQFADIPNESYDVPNLSSGAPSQSYGIPSVNSDSPTPSYGVPRASTASLNTRGTPSGNFLGNKPAFRATSPSTSYGPPPSAVVRSNTQYGVPSNGNNLETGGYSFDHQDNSYGAELSEPANYEFEYMVNDPQSGNDFGQRESRQGDLAQGSYYVSLPDGRRLIVDYRADKNGYQPNVRYEGEAKYPTPTKRPATQNENYGSNDVSNGYDSNSGYNNDANQDGYVY